MGQTLSGKKTLEISDSYAVVAPVKGLTNLLLRRVQENNPAGAGSVKQRRSLAGVNEGLAQLASRVDSLGPLGPSLTYLVQTSNGGRTRLKSSTSRDL